MAQDDPFTIDLFGNTALLSGLGLGVTTFAADLDGDDHDRDPPPSAPAPAAPAFAPARAREPNAVKRGDNFHLAGDRGLAKGWKQRARDSVAAIRLAAQIEAEQRPASPDEQRQLMRFTGFGASELANGVFRRPGASEFAKGWEEIGADLEDAIDDAGYASLARCTQYAHLTPRKLAGSSARAKSPVKIRARGCSSRAMRAVTGSISPSATRRSPTGPCARIARTGRWAFGCTTTSSREQSTS